MNLYTEIFERKIELIEGGLLGAEYDKYDRYAAFISISDKENRAKVFRASADSPKAAWQEAKEKARRFVANKDLNPVWIKGDITKRIETMPFSDVISDISKGCNECFRRGISFDKKLETALIEAEINGSRVISYKSGAIELTVVNRHLSANDLRTISSLPEELVLFDCASVFCDENNEIYELYGEGENCGRRKSGDITKQTALGAEKAAADYLSMMVGMDGRFDYGYYPVYHRPIPGYNILKHILAVPALINSYKKNKSTFMLRQIQNAMDYIVANTYYKYKDREVNTAFTADRENREVCIAGNALALIAMTEYMSAVGTDDYNKLCAELGNGIAEMYNETKGTFCHILSFPSLKKKSEYKSSFFDSETANALVRLYGITKDERHLDMSRAAVDAVIARGRANADHWLVDSVYRLAEYGANEKHLDFVIEHAAKNISDISELVPAAPAQLEYLLNVYSLCERIEEQGLECGAYKDFDKSLLVKTIMRRAEYLLNGFGYPEYVMYFKQPEVALDAFFVRDDGYRVRIDDIYHFCHAYHLFSEMYDRINKGE